MIDANTLVTHVRRVLAADGYRDAFDVGPDQTVTTLKAPSAEFCLSKLGLVALPQ